MSRKLVFGVVAMLMLGMPLHATWQLVALALAFLVIVIGRVRTNAGWRWLGVLVFAQIVTFFWIPPQWEEGHNLFVPNEHNLATVYQPQLPAHVLHGFLAEYRAAYPNLVCDPDGLFPWKNRAPCWTEFHLNPERFARSADAFFVKADYSRFVQSIAHQPTIPFAADVLFDLSYVWRLFAENPNKTPSAFYVAYRVTPAMRESTLCWQGPLYWEQRLQIEDAQAQPTCRQLTDADVGDRFWALHLGAPKPLSLNLAPSSKLQAQQFAHRAFVLLSLVLVLFLGLEISAVGWTPIVIFISTATLMGVVAPDFLLGLPGHLHNRDAMLYLSWARQIALDLVDGNIAHALEGGEPVFGFMPGMRYFRALELFVFGSSGFGQALCVLFIPMVLYELMRELTPRLSVFLVFVLLSVTKFVQIIKAAVDGYSDPLGLLLICSALLIFVRHLPALKEARENNQPDPALALGFVVLGISTFLRPNFVLAAILICLLWVWRRPLASFMTVKPLETIGIFLVLAMPLHNWVFGHQFVPMTTATSMPDALTAPPSVYVGALQELLQATPADNVRILTKKFVGWWWPGHWILFFVPMVLTFSSELRSERLRLLAAIAFTLQLPHLFFRSGGREMMAANILALLVVLAAAAIAWDRRQRTRSAMP
jgi:hypothetical protein